MIRDDNESVLLVRRRDNGEWVMPAGQMEIGESVWDVLVREVAEETGLRVVAATLIAINSAPRYHFTNAFGGKHQMLSFVFRVDEWLGYLSTETNETVDARFFRRDKLPPVHEVYQETLADLNGFDGKPILK